MINHISGQIGFGAGWKWFGIINHKHETQKKGEILPPFPDKKVPFHKRGERLIYDPDTGCYYPESRKPK